MERIPTRRHPSRWARLRKRLKEEAERNRTLAYEITTMRVIVRQQREIIKNQEETLCELIDEMETKQREFFEVISKSDNQYLQLVDAVLRAMPQWSAQR